MNCTFVCDQLLLLLFGLLLLSLTHVSSGTKPKFLAEDENATSNPVPFGHVPYSPSLPGAMGPQWSFPVEWWFYAGWAQSAPHKDNQPGPKLTLFLQLTRYAIDGKSRAEGTKAHIMYGFGTTSEKNTSESRFFANYSFAMGFHSKKSPGHQLGLIIPPPTQDKWYCEGRTTTMQMTNQLTDGILGLAKASYKLEMVDTSQDVKAVFNLFDPFGAIIEVSSKITPTYEFALPSLNIMNGSYIILNDVKYNLVDGNLWLDRQTCTYAPLLGSKLSYNKLSLLHHHPVAGQQLYVGQWLAIVMNNKTVYEILIFWPQKEDQWIVGDKLNPPYPPIKVFSVKYPYRSEWMDWIGIPAIQGVSVLDQDQFDLNIFNPSNPSDSPHWTSPVSNQTYGTKWQMELDGKQYVMTILVPESEVTGGTEYFYEGAAAISDANDPSGQPVGYAVVEQMGYTQ